METLEVFYRRLPSDCEQLDSLLAQDDMKNFSIAIHGMKSMLSTVGAMTLSDMALKLEESSTPGEKGSALFLAESSEKAQSAAENFEVNQGIAIIDSLTEFDYGEQINSLLANAAVAFKNFDYDTVLKIISKITAI